MGSDWSSDKLINLTTKIGSGATPRGGSNVYLEEGDYALIRSQNVYNHGFEANGIVYIDKDAADKLKNVVVMERDVLINITGDSVARTCLAPSGFLPARVNQHVCIIRTHIEKLIPEFLRYFLIGKPSQYHLLSLASSGGTRNALTKGMIEDLEIPLPPLPEQKAIAHVLGSLDDKIELNRQMNETLEAMAQALFKSWFVDFDPVLDKALSAGHEIPEPLQAKAKHRLQLGERRKKLPQEVMDLFPDKFQWVEEFGWIPEGWEVALLGDSTLELRRGIAPKYTEVGGVLVLNQKCVRNRQLNFSLGRRNDPDKRKVVGRELIDGDVLINSTGQGTLGRVAQFRFFWEPVVVDTHVTIVRPNQDLLKKFWFGRSMFQLEKIFERMGEGSTGQTELKRAKLNQLSLVVPSLDLQIYADSIFESVSDSKEKNNQESQTLTKLRDTLLPKLISGEIPLKPPS